ncbi:MAG: hypothetical protein GWN01_05860, partial [Nitrosopumilaceae archaeon]|nr:hypothetical protein [Nitrosopumilaceae archaeon]NIV65507.1 hypothetical protein [Nitrosopumilaceae archaeon]NIX61067.1 hypothetical protein [Nitrosopumilaceae archaeon]
ARSQDREDPDTEALIKNLLEKKDSFQFPEAEKPVDEEQAYTQTSPSPLDETEASPTERTKQLAKKLSLGTGEIELALNLSAHHHYATHDRDDLRSRILQ